MKKLLLLSLFFGTVFTSASAQSVICNDFDDDAGISIYETPATGYITTSVSNNTLTVTYNNAPSWADWQTGAAELKWTFPNTVSVTGVTLPAVIYDIEVTSLTLTGTGCGTSLPLGINVVDDVSNYGTGESSTIGYWEGLDTTHFTKINTTHGTQHYNALATIAIKPAIPAGCTVSGTVLIKNLCIGPESMATDRKEAVQSITSSRLYPNPVSDLARVELNLKSSSAIKVTLSDLMGKEVMTIADGTFVELNKDFSVATLNKGIYTVNYYINGSATKAEMLMVK